MERAGLFTSTLWSDILRAKDADDPRRASALNRLCQTYWEPLYVYLRHKGLIRQDAEDATQGFFAHFLEKGLLARVERGRGRFRSYLLATLEHYMANEHRLRHAQKREAAAPGIPLDFARAEKETRLDPADPEPPGAAYRRVWVVTVMRRAFEALGREFGGRWPREHFQAVWAQLEAGREGAGYEGLSKRLGCSVSDVRNLLHALRKRLGEIIRSILRETVDTDAEVEEEVVDLFKSC